MIPQSVAETAALLAAGGYVADNALATTVHLSLAMRRPLFLEGEPGTGKTEIAKVLASGLKRRLVRLQCYDGLDLAAAAYEWDHARQLMAIRIAEAAGSADRQVLASDIYAREFLQARPLLSAVDPDLPPAVLLIDELDRADEPFEAFLLELLAEFQITIPELGTIKAAHRPRVILTSNRSRELSDALRRRCLYLWQGYPTREQETQILHARLPGISVRLGEQIAGVMQVLRALPFHKVPGVAEAIDWGLALMSLHAGQLDAQTVRLTRGCILKAREDWTLLDGKMALLEPIWNVSIGERQAMPEGNFGSGNVSVRR